MLLETLRPCLGPGGRGGDGGRGSAERQGSVPGQPAGPREPGQEENTAEGGNRTHPRAAQTGGPAGEALHARTHTHMHMHFHVFSQTFSTADFWHRAKMDGP